MPDNSNIRAIFKNFLRQAGLAPGAFGNILDAAVRGDWSVDEFAVNLYATKQFRRMFPGIFRADGSMRMDPFAYRQLTDQYKSTARMYGITSLSKQHIGKLIRSNVSMQEFSDRMTAIQRVQEYKPAWQEFIEVARSRGFKTGLNGRKLNSDKELVNFMLGRQPKKFYSLWDELNTGIAAREAGLNKELGQGMIRSISKRMAGIADETQLQSKFQNLAQTLQKVMPLSKIAGYGLTKKDLVTLEFGGSNQAAIAEKVERVLAQQEGFDMDRAYAGRADIGRSQQQYAQSA